MDTAEVETTVSELLTRPGHEKVRTLLHRLLTDGLHARSTDIDFEKRVPEVRGRIDALLGRTVFEVKSDLRREEQDAKGQLGRYLPEREQAVGVPFIGVVTDGATWRVYECREEKLAQLGSDFIPSVADPRSILIWLESVVVTSEHLIPETVSLQKELGRESVAYQRALREIASQ